MRRRRVRGSIRSIRGCTGGIPASSLLLDGYPEVVMALDAELAVLFGRSVLAQSKRVPVAALEVNAELVAEGARQLREAEGQPVRQRAIVEAMDEDTQLALCKWIREPDMGRKLQEQVNR